VLGWIALAITVKQAEAFYWVAKLGSVIEASAHLNLAQSTLSKRISELEAIIGTSLFDRGNRAIVLTRTGENLIPIAGDLIRLEVRFRESAIGALAFSGPFRFGVTELVALTWLPKLIVAIKETYPDVIPEPEVDASVNLFSKLKDYRLDLVVGLDPPSEGGFSSVPLDSVALQWMCAPNFGPMDDVVPLREIATYPVLTQTEGSGLHRLVLDYASGSEVKLNRIVRCNSLTVLATLAAAGLGITVLNEHYFQPEIANGLLRVIRTSPELPPASYYASFRSDALDPLAHNVALLARACCDFSIRRSAMV
jgi:DNA-binding transcriptional LysR family regulator